MSSKSVLNLVIRFAMLASRSVFIFFAAKFIGLEELGLYSLVGAAVGYSLYVVGLDFYAYSTRQLIGGTIRDQSLLILDHIRVCLISYAFFSLPLMLIFKLGYLSWDIAAVFFGLLFFEVLSQELTRMIVALEKPLTASLILFIRTSFWCYVVAVAYFVSEGYRDVELIFVSWLMSSFLSVVASLWVLKFVAWSSLFRSFPQKKLMLQGLKVALPMLVSTVAIKTLLTVDRFVVGAIDGLWAVGVYAIYIGICNALMSFMDAAVFQIKYPILVRCVNDCKYDEFLKALRAFSSSVLFYLVVMVGSLIVGSSYLFGLLGKEELLENMRVYWVVVAAYALLLISYIPHYALFALRKDRGIVFSHILGLGSFPIFFFAFVSFSGMERVSIALFLACALVLVVKTLLVSRLLKKAKLGNDLKFGRLDECP